MVVVLVDSIIVEVTVLVEVKVVKMVLVLVLVGSIVVVAVIHVSVAVELAERSALKVPTAHGSHSGSDVVLPAA